jgi:hypothetical protein
MEGIIKQKYESLTQKTRCVSVFNGKKYDLCFSNRLTNNISKDKKPGGFYT